MALTRNEVTDVRIERVLPYLNNTAGLTLDQLLLIIDSKLKDASPDAMTPSLINWSNKDLFVEKWTKVSGMGTLSYNEFGLSKIAKGRFEINGTGLWEYDKFVPVSDTRGVTGKIYIGANNLASIVNVGVRCYDANKTYLGTNGGFLCNSLSPSAINNYRFYKTTAFGESASSLKTLKPNTKFVKLYIETIANSGITFFDESEMTTFELDERYVQIFTNEIDWNTAEFFYSELAGDTTYTFASEHDGRVRTIFVKNTTASNINVDFPTANWQGQMALRLIRPGKTSGFTFIKAGGVVWASVIEEF